MKCLLVYYTGTYNTRYITNKLKEKLTSKNIDVDTYEFNPLIMEKIDFTNFDLVGIGYPIYAFNVPSRFLKFIKKQKFPKQIKTFIYKNSGETYHANDASSINIVRKLKRNKAIINNEYHFVMPYNIHFRFDENLIAEMLEIDNKLLDILVYEVVNNIPNIKRYKFIHKIITFFLKIQYLGGFVNSFFYKVKKDKCSNCNKCVNECPTKNIIRNKNGKLKFKTNCLMCMRCSLNCPNDAISIGLLDLLKWRVNKPYDFKKISQIHNDNPIITNDTKGFFKCYIETYKNINERYEEIKTDF